jgi:hypothetical protein
MRGWITIEFLSTWVRESPLFGSSLALRCFFSGQRASEHSRLGARPDTIWRPSVLADPVLNYRDANGNSLMANDNWRGHSTIVDSDQWLCVANDVEFAIAIALSPGNYTAILSGKNNATGNALVEVYALN